MPLPVAGLQGNGPNRLPVLQPRLGSGPLLICPPLEPIHPGTLQDGPRLNEAGTLTGRPFSLLSGKTIATDQIPWPMHPRISEPRPEDPGCSPHRETTPEGTIPPPSRDVRFLSALQPKQGRDGCRLLLKNLSISRKIWSLLPRNRGDM